MNVIRTVLFISAFLAMLPSCVSQTDPSLKVSGYENFPNNLKIELKPFNELKGGMIMKIFLSGQRFFATDVSAKKDNLIYCFDMKSGTQLSSYFQRTNKEFGGISPLSSGIIQDSTLWFYDFQLDRIVQTNINSHDSSFAPVQTNLKSKFRQIQLLSDSTALVNGKFWSEDNAELSIINYKNDTAVYNFESFPREQDGISASLRNDANQGILHYHSPSQMAVFAKNLTDEFYIINIAKKNILKVRGPEYTSEEAATSRTRRFFVSGGALTTDLIYLSFTTKEENGQSRNQSKTILVFDWQGKPIRKIELSEFVSAFAVIEETNEIIGFNRDSGMFYKATLNAKN